MLPFLFSLTLAPVIPSSEPSVRFARWETFDPRLDTVEIWTKAEWKDGKQLPPTAIMRRTISYRPELKLKGKTVYLATSAECRDILPALERLAQMQMPTIQVSALPDSEAATIVRADGVSYRLSTEAYFPLEAGKVDLTFGADTPVAEWIDQSLRNFALCWQSEPSR